jgi:hypothetical protein
MTKPTVSPWATFLRASGAGQILGGNSGGAAIGMITTIFAIHGER